MEVPQPCTLLFQGTNLAGKPISQTCPYSGTAENPATQQCFFGPDFKDVKTVNVTISTSFTVPLATVAFLDNVNHTNYY